MNLYFTIHREGGIPLEEWTEYVARSKVFKLYPVRTGINPFTKESTVFRPAPGSAFFDTKDGQGSIGFQSGVLSVDATDAKAIPIIEEMARTLNAVVRTEVPE